MVFAKNFARNFEKNNTWNIRRLIDETIGPFTQRINTLGMIILDLIRFIIISFHTVLCRSRASLAMYVLCSTTY